MGVHWVHQVQREVLSSADMLLPTHHTLSLLRYEVFRSNLCLLMSEKGLEFLFLAALGISHLSKGYLEVVRVGVQGQ